jgi:hypothetical protein
MQVATPPDNFYRQSIENKDAIRQSIHSKCFIRKVFIQWQLAPVDCLK